MAEGQPGLDISGQVQPVAESAAAVGAFPSNSSVSSVEQLFTPILVSNPQLFQDSSGIIPGLMNPVNDANSLGRFAGFNLSGTRSELDPYFSSVRGNEFQWFIDNDFQMMVNDGNSPAEEVDINIRKTSRNASTVSVTHFRGPMLMAGFGFDHADRPVPSDGGVLNHHEDTARNRGLWKAGPIALKWDAIWKVWGAGHHMICGVATQDISAPLDPCNPTFFSIRVLRNENASEVPIPIMLSNCETSETCIITNRDPSLSQELVDHKVWVVAARVNYEYIPIWVGCPEKPDSSEEEEEKPECICDGTEDDGPDNPDIES